MSLQFMCVETSLQHTCVLQICCCKSDTDDARLLLGGTIMRAYMCTVPTQTSPGLTNGCLVVHDADVQTHRVPPSISKPTSTEDNSTVSSNEMQRTCV